MGLLQDFLRDSNHKEVMLIDLLSIRHQHSPPSATYLEGSAGSFISSSRAIGRYIEAGGGGKIDSPMGIFWDSGLVAPTLPPVFSFSRASTTFFSFDVSTTAIFLKFSISG